MDSFPHKATRTRGAIARKRLPSIPPDQSVQTGIIKNVNLIYELRKKNGDTEIYFKAVPGSGGNKTKEIHYTDPGCRSTVCKFTA